MIQKKRSRKVFTRASAALAMTLGILTGMIVTAEAKTGGMQYAGSAYSEEEPSYFADSPYILQAKKGTSSVNVKEIKLSRTKAETTVGRTVKITAKVLPEDASDQKVRWSVIKGGRKLKLYSDSGCKNELGSKATDILTVYAKGISVGTAVIEAESSESSGIHAECSVKVGEAPVPTASKDPRSFSFMRFRMTNIGKYEVSLAWDKVPEATRYVLSVRFIDGKDARNRVINLDKGKTSYTVKGLTPQWDYKIFMHVYDGRKEIVPGKHAVHIKTNSKVFKGAFSPSSIQVQKSEVSLNKNETYKISATAKVSRVTFNYESTDPKIASVNKSGVIKAHEKGRCYVYVYAQNGVYSRIAVTVK